jgi:hypothetical protein
LQRADGAALERSPQVADPEWPRRLAPSLRYRPGKGEAMTTIVRYTMLLGLLTTMACAGQVNGEADDAPVTDELRCQRHPDYADCRPRRAMEPEEPAPAPRCGAVSPLVECTIARECIEGWGVGRATRDELCAQAIEYANLACRNATGADCCQITSCGCEDYGDGYLGCQVVGGKSL